MKFSCPKCDTKYSIADEKVRGKVLKIRCKKCENVITLREPAPSEGQQPPAEEPTRAVAMDPATLASLRQSLEKPAPEPRKETATSGRGASTTQGQRVQQPPQRMATATGMPLRPADPATSGANALASAPAQPGGVEWFLAIKGQQVGPVSSDEVRAKLAAGEAELRTYAWCDGMGDWKRLQDIPEFRQTATVSKPPPPVMPPPPPPDTNGGAQVVDLQAEIARRQRKPALEVVDAALPAAQRSPTDPFGQMLNEKAIPHGNTGTPVDAHAAAADPFAAVPDSAASSEGPPRESTRMFIAAAGLANRSRKHRIYAAIGSVVAAGLFTILYLDATGIYQIPIVTQLVDISYAAVGAEPPPRKARVVDPDEDSEWDFSGLNKVRKPKVAKRTGGPAKMPTNLGEGGVDLGKALGDAQAGSGTTLAERQGDNAAADVAVQSDATKSAGIAEMLKGGRGQIEVKNDLGRKSAEGTPNALLTDQAKGADTPLKPDQIARVVSDQKASMTSCANDAAKAGEKFRGTLKVTVLIGPSGKVQKVTVNDLKQVETTLGQCLGRALMRWVFPRFQGEAFEAELPLKLSVGS